MIICIFLFFLINLYVLIKSRCRLRKSMWWEIWFNWENYYICIPIVCYVNCNTFMFICDYNNIEESKKEVLAF